MRRTRSAEAAMSLLGVALLVALPLASTSGALGLDELVTTTTSSILAEPLADAVTSVVASLDPMPTSTSSTTTSSTTTTVAAGGGGQGVTTTTVPTDASGEATAPTPVGPSAAPSPAAPVGAPSTGAPAAARPPAVPSVGLPAAGSSDVGGSSSAGAGTGATVPGDGGPEAAVHRELTVQLAVGLGATGGAGVRSTDALFDSLAGLRLAPIQVARLLAPFPVAGRASYTDDWGQPRHGPGDLERRHEGVDVFAARGTPVIASADGVVSRMTTGGSLSGVGLRLTAADGTYYVYAHLDRFAAGLDDGEEVAKGQVLGFVGNTGNAVSTPPHLHFEIHPRGGAAVPPVPYLDRWLSEAAQSIAALAAAPAAARAGVLREQLGPRAAPAPAGASVAGGAADGAGAAGRDLGRLRAIASGRGFGATGLLVVAAVAAWALRRWARARSREDQPMAEGWTMVDLAALARDDEDRVLESAGRR